MISSTKQFLNISRDSFEQWKPLTTKSQPINRQNIPATWFTFRQNIQVHLWWDKNCVFFSLMGFWNGSTSKIKNDKCSFVWCLSQIRKLSETTKKEVPMDLEREGIFIYIMRNIKAITSQKLAVPTWKNDAWKILSCYDGRFAVLS